MLSLAVLSSFAIYGVLHLLLITSPWRVPERAQLLLTMTGGIGTAWYLGISHPVLVGLAAGAMAFAWGMVLNLVSITGDQAIRRITRR